MARRSKQKGLGSKAASGSEQPIILSPSQENALREIGPAATSNGFVLGGGTALALQLHHRRSRDFDFFTYARFDDSTAFVQTLKSAGVDLNVTHTKRGTLHASTKGIEVSFIEFLYPELRPAVYEKTFKTEMIDLHDLAAMKANALLQRGLKRDFVDIYALLKSGVGIAQMITAFEGKFGFDNTRSILLALNYFEDAERSEMPEMIWPVDWNEVKKGIQKAVHEFSRMKRT